MKNIQTFCARDCYDSCSLLARVDGSGQLLSLRGDPHHPVTKGFTCPRNRGDIKRLYTNRVLWPYVRSGPKPGRHFKEITTNKSFDLATQKLIEVLEKYGPEKVLLLDYAGNHGLLTSTYPRRLWNAIGATRTDYTLCNTTGKVAISLHYGLGYGLQPEELVHKKTIIYWGLNAAESFPHAWAFSLMARKQAGAKIVVVDPRQTPTAKNADIWIQPRPGADAAIAFGIARYLIEANLIDVPFINNWTQGFNAYKEMVMEWTPERVEQASGVPWNMVEKMARTYGENQPSAMMIGVGFQKTINGGQSVRATCLLPALVGQHRGFFYANSSGFFLDKAYLSGENHLSDSPITVSQVDLGEKVGNGDFKFIFIYCMNPALTLPNQNAFRKGLSRDDAFVVLHDTHWTETANFADIILPAQTFLEKDDIIIPWTHWYAGKSVRLIPPMGKSINEIQVMRKIAVRLDLKQEWLFEDPWEAVRICLGHALNKEDMEKLFEGQSVRLKYRPLEEYQTQSGKIEFCSTRAEDMGYTPLPDQVEETTDGHGFTLLNSSTIKYSHTQFQEVFGPIPSIVKINQKDAHSKGIHHAQMARLYNEYGQCSVTMAISEDVPPGVLWTPKQHPGLNGEPMNSLCPGRPQEIGGGSTYNSIRVEIKT